MRLKLEYFLYINQQMTAKTVIKAAWKIVSAIQARFAHTDAHFDRMFIQKSTPPKNIVPQIKPYKADE
jgi:hypothetical protein